MEMIKEVLKSYFLKHRSKLSIFGIFLQEMILAYDTAFFEGLSRLFTQTQNFIKKPKQNIQGNLENMEQQNITLTDPSAFSISVDSNLLTDNDDSQNFNSEIDSFSLDNYTNLKQVDQSISSFSLEEDKKSSLHFGENSSSFLLDDQENSFSLDDIINSTENNTTTAQENETDTESTCSSLGAFGSDQVSLSFPHSPVLSRKPLQMVKQEKSLLSSLEETTTLTHNNDEIIMDQDSFSYEDDDDDDETPLIDQSSLSIHHWSEMENSWFPELQNIRLRRSKSLPFNALSPIELQEFIKSQVYHLRKIIENENLNSELTFYELEEKINKFRSMSPNETSIHYLSFLLQKKQKNVTKSIDELHRYFDYQLFNNKSNPFYSNHENILPFTVISLASLYYEFGNYEEGIESIREAIRLSQERSDDNSLVQALYWLYCYLNENEPKQQNSHFCKKNPTKEETEIYLSFYQKTLKFKNNYHNINRKQQQNKAITNSSSLLYNNYEMNSSSSLLQHNDMEQQNKKLFELLERCLHRSKEQKMSVWFSLNLFALIELLLHSNNPNIFNSSIFYDNDNESFQNSSFSSSSNEFFCHQEMIWNLLSKCEKSSLESNISALISKYSALKSSIWSQYGHKDLSRLYSQISLEQIDKINEINPNEHNLSNYEFSKEDFCNSLCKISFQHAQDGNYEKSFSILLDFISSTSNAKEIKIFRSNCFYLLFYFALDCNCLQIAEIILSNSCNDSFQFPFYLECKAKLLFKKNEFFNSISIIKNQILPFINHNQWKLNIRVSILLSEIYIALHQFSNALFHILNAFSLSKKYKFFPSFIHSSLLLAEIYSFMNENSRAIQLMDQIFPISMHHGNSFCKAQTHLLYAKIHFKIIQNNSTMDNCNNNDIDSLICSHLKNALHEFSNLENIEKIKESHYYLSLFYHFKGQFSDRDESASLFSKVSDAIAIRAVMNKPKFSSSSASRIAEQLFEILFT